MKSFTLVIILILSLLLITTFASCTSKKDRCEEIAFSMMKQSAISNQKYLSQKIQKACVKYYDERGYSDWRSCMISAENSLSEMQKCKIPPFISFAILNN